MIYFILLKIKLFLFQRLSIKAKPSKQRRLRRTTEYEKNMTKIYHMEYDKIKLHSCLIFPFQQTHIQNMNSPLIHFKIFFQGLYLLFKYSVSLV